MIGSSSLETQYDLLACLSRSCFSETYLAIDRAHPQRPQRIVKRLLPWGCDRQLPGFVTALFAQEAALLATLGSLRTVPNLLHVSQSAQPMMVQEFVAGTSIQAQMEPGRHWCQSTLITFLRDALCILRDIHQCGIIHRDIKPQHWIRRSADQSLVLVDFGGAQDLSAPLTPQVRSMSPQTAATQTIVSSLGYTAPEQLQGQATFSSDLYALGMTAIQGITGLTPVAFEHTARGELNWHTAAPHLNSDLADILVGMVRPALQERYASADEVLRDLPQQTDYSSWMTSVSQWLKPAPKDSQLPGHLAPPSWKSTLLPKPAQPGILDPQATGRSPADPEPPTVVVIAPPKSQQPTALLEPLQAHLQAQGFRIVVHDAMQPLPSQATVPLTPSEPAPVAHILLIAPEQRLSSILLQQLQTLRVQSLRRSDGTPAPQPPLLMPIRLDYPGDAPLAPDLRMTLQGLRQHLWRSPTDLDRILSEVDKALQPLTPI